MNFKNSLKFPEQMERVDGLDDQALAASLHFVVKVAALRRKRVGGNSEP